MKSGESRYGHGDVLAVPGISKDGSQISLEFTITPRELRLSAEAKEDAVEIVSNVDINADGTIAGYAPRKSFAQAASQIVVADVSMSLDNVLAVAGAARDHLTVLVIGLGLSVALMGIAANYIAHLLHGHRWIAYAGLLIILYVAFEMIYRGASGIWPLVVSA
jgi:predicted tellurium resistance membrane protein TerC